MRTAPLTWIAALLLAGCGYQTYEQRLGESQRYFAYLEKLDSNLAAPAPKEGSIEEIRVPLQFRQVPKPAMVKNEKGESVPPDVDPRQPNYLLIEFKGLNGTWEAVFDITTTAGREKRKGYIYALANASLFISDPDTAADYTKNILAQLAGALRVPTPDATAAVLEEYPRSKTYTQPNKFDVYRFSSDQVVIDDLPHTVEVYVHRQGDVQFLLVIVLPAGIDNSTAKLTERIPLMLERLKISSKRQAAAKKGGAAATGPASATLPSTTGF